MLISVADFCDRTRASLEDLVSDLQEHTGRYGEQEAVAWRSSLPKIADVLNYTQLGSAHLAFQKKPGVGIEYRLPASSSWADAVLLGRGETGPQAIFIELKDWDTSQSHPGPSPGLVEHGGGIRLHPSEQVRGYVDYCRRFHSAVLDRNAQVHGLVFFTRSRSVDDFAANPHDTLTRDFPVFSANTKDTRDRLPEFLRSRIVAPDEQFAHAFVGGAYRQDRSFVRGMSEVIRDPSKSPFVLLDHQRLGLEQCLYAIARAKENNEQRAVVIVEGPPGSGKSVLAAQLWAELIQRATKSAHNESVVLVTTSACQRSNWSDLFEKVSGRKGGKGAILPSNQFNPGLNHPWREKQLNKGLEISTKTWRENLDLLRKDGVIPKVEDCSIGVSIVDESHALIDPTLPGTEGISPSGWMIHAGPQAHHVMRGSKVTVFLMDSEQSYRDNETTTASQIEALAGELGVARVERVSLEDSQFRCGGSKEYLDWLDGLLDLGKKAQPLGHWSKDGSSPFSLTIAESPFQLEDQLREKIASGRTARLVASYNRPWLSKGLANPHSLAPEQRDFHIEVTSESTKRHWSKVWNFAPDQDYSCFIQAHPGSAIAADPLCEVGCPYVVRGFDYDYLGVLWGSDLVWRGEWTVQLQHVHESAWKKTLAAAKKNNAAALKRTRILLARAYRILLSRAVHGAFVWFEDEQTREHVESLLRRRS